ncbi:hypothetical protein GC207_00040 [bacterium]|nr:hypothetical protein [bacterium]
MKKELIEFLSHNCLGIPVVVWGLGGLIVVLVGFVLIAWLILKHVRHCRVEHSQGKTIVEIDGR